MMTNSTIKPAHLQSNLKHQNKPKTTTTHTATPHANLKIFKTTLPTNPKPKYTTLQTSPIYQPQVTNQIKQLHNTLITQNSTVNPHKPTARIKNRGKADIYYIISTLHRAKKPQLTYSTPKNPTQTT